MLAQCTLYINIGSADLDFTLPVFLIQVIVDDMGFAQKALTGLTERHFEGMHKKGARQIKIDKTLLAVKGIGQKVDVGHKLYTRLPYTLYAAVHVVHLAIAIDKKNFYAYPMHKGRLKHHPDRGLFDGSMTGSTLETVEEKAFSASYGLPLFVSESACQSTSRT